MFLDISRPKEVMKKKEEKIGASLATTSTAATSSTTNTIYTEYIAYVYNSVVVHLRHVCNPRTPTFIQDHTTIAS